MEYRAGRFNAVTDTLSHRNAEALTSAAISRPSFQLFNDLRAECAQDPEWLHLRDQLASGALSEPW